MTSVPFFLAFFTSAVAYALLRGGGPERVTAAAYSIALAGSLVVGTHVPGNFRVVPIGLFSVDLALLIALCVIAIRANRWWIIPAAGCQLVTVLVHAGKALHPAMIPNSYAFLADILSWPMVMFLAAGVWAYRRRRAKRITMPDWKPFSVPPRSRMPS